MSIKGGAERSNLKFEMFWPLIVIKAFPAPSLYVEQSEPGVKLHGAPGLAETMLMTQNRFKLYNSPTVKTRSCVQQELQSPSLLFKNNRNEDWKILIISLDDLIWSWFVCFSKQEGAAQKEAHQKTSPSNKNIIFTKRWSFEPHILSTWPIKSCN